MTNFGALQTEVQAVGPFSTTTASLGRIALWLNQAQHWWLSKRRWAVLETQVTVASVSGQATYVLSGTSPIVTDFEELIDVQHNQANAGTTFVKLRYLDQQTFDALLANAGATPGIPIFYTIRGGAPQTTGATILSGGNQALQMWPVPNYVGSIKASYFRSVASCEMALSTDVPIVPVQYHSALVMHAAGYGLMTKGQVLQGSQLMAQAEEIAQMAIQADTIARRGDMPLDQQPIMPGSIPPTPSAGANPGNSPYGVRAA